MFARRPKLTGKEKLVLGKINYELFQFADAARAVGIPTIAGFPAVSTLHDLHSDPPILWLPVEQSSEGELVFLVDIARPAPIPTDKGAPPIRTLSLEDVIEEVANKAEVLSWDDAMGHISQLRLEHFREGLFGLGWFGGYKPVYFLIAHDR